MATGNTIGRIVGQSPVRAVPVEGANPVVELFQGLERLVPMWQQLEGLAQQLTGGGRGGAAAAIGGLIGGAIGGAGGVGAALGGAGGVGAALGGAGGVGAALGGLIGGALGGAGGTGAPGPGGVASVEELGARLTELGRVVRTPPEAMDGPARPEQRRTRQITEEMLRVAMDVSGPRGQPVHELALGAARERIEALAATAPSPARAAQAVGNALTMAQMRGANGPVLEMLRSVLAGLQQALGLLQGITGRNDGAQIRRSPRQTP
ncbi:hypothetical protein [Sorangium sp. So ce1024]|uniref:hypothetical protein n=1 Tax=Sorangium sp. So ce1024 TaxID=3133327 RepID=UPI003F0E9AA9